MKILSNNQLMSISGGGQLKVAIEFIINEIEFIKYCIWEYFYNVNCRDKGKKC